MKLLASRPKFTPKQRAEIRDRQDGLCYLCQISLADGFHVDHRVSLALYGAHDETNWQALCIGCHSRKSGAEAKIWAKVRRILKWGDPKTPSRLQGRGFPKDLRRGFDGKVTRKETP